VGDAEHPGGQIYPFRGGKDGNPPEGAPRRLAAIVAGDIAGYSRLMGHDEEGTHARVKRHRREIIEPTIAENHGRLVKYTGDGFLAMFDSPVEAVRCAIVIQQTVVGRNASIPREQWILYRIGVHLGDVIVERDDIYGEGVNIAARLEGIANPGDLYVSGGVYEQIKNKLVCAYQPLGDRQVKNITDPVTVYRVLPDPYALMTARKGRRTVVLVGLGILMIAALGSAIGFYIWIRQLLVAYQQPAAVQAPKTAFTTPATGPALPPTASTPSAADAPSARSQAAAPSPPAAAPDAPIRAAPSPVAPAVPSTSPASPPASTPAPSDASSARPQAAAPSPPAAAPNAPTRAAPSIVPNSPAVGLALPTMVSLPGGTFAMGSNDDPSEKPIHRVTIKPFAISKFPITNREWKECVAAKGCDYVPVGNDDAPVANLSWNDARQFVEWLSKVTLKEYRLPSEAEWEYAARGGTQTKYWWGDQLRSDLAYCKGCVAAYDSTQPLKVGSFRPNPFGLHDMGGNIDQWVEDCWHKDYQGAPIDGSAWIEKNCASHVIRSGSWKNDTNYVRPASRDRYDTAVRYPTHGLRVATTP
jgi:formylglycine-generating enzyme required for sulfatase activity/class 3 adenylate cyclase